ncbi:hypothetical protein PWR63_32350 [Paraburkholderia sp. A2WS-5]|uniref:hypothetical protein n=1 Tax=unclassified Paraburkholderia TaxID=2615204 RepID=UPI003B82C584
MFKVSSAKVIVFSIASFGFAAGAFAQQSPTEKDPAVAANQAHPLQVAATQGVASKDAAKAATPAAGNQNPSPCVGPASFCNIYLGS